MKRCSGHCCEHFTVGYMHEMKRTADPIIERFNQGEKLNADELDTLKVIEMVVPWPAGMIDKDGEKTNGDGLYYCRHFDFESRNCTNYEDRPNTCRNFPYAKRCVFTQCTYEAAQRSMAPGMPWVMKKLGRYLRGEFRDNDYYRRFLQVFQEEGPIEGQEIEDNVY